MKLLKRLTFKIACKNILPVLFLIASLNSFGAGSKPIVLKEIPELQQDKVSDAMLGARIQRTMTLLATSNPSCRRKVKILFYGQSITAGLHSDWMIEQLRKKYPNAEIIWENRAIGGFTAPILYRVAYHDLCPYYPDLVLFHVYGGTRDGELDEIVSQIRKNTTAEILMWTHHIRSAGKNVEGNPNGWSGMEGDGQGADYRRFLAQKYGCELVDVREKWIKYLNENKIPAYELMGNGVDPNVHPNPTGHRLLAKMLMPHFRFNPRFEGNWMNMVKTYSLPLMRLQDNPRLTFSGKNWRATKTQLLVRGAKNKLKFTFTGNRIDIIPGSAFPGKAQILIDGKKPSEIPELYACTRPSSLPVKKHWPALFRATLGAKPVAEEWTLKISEIKDKFFKFKLSGSVTGEDGEGDNKNVFISNSGRVKIQPGDFKLLTRRLPELKNFDFEKYSVKWKYYLMGSDTYGPVTEKIDPAADYAITVAQGLENTKHTLEIIQTGNQEVRIKGIRVYRPPLED